MGSEIRTIDDYVAAAAPAARPILERIRAIVREAAPHAREAISYRVAAFRGHGVLVYFAAFKGHIGFFPPVRGDPNLEAALTPYRGPKGNLRFPLGEPIPYDLIGRIARLRAEQDRAKALAAKQGRRSRA